MRAGDFGFGCVGVVVVGAVVVVGTVSVVPVVVSEGPLGGLVSASTDAAATPPARNDTSKRTRPIRLTIFRVYPPKSRDHSQRRDPFPEYPEEGGRSRILLDCAHGSAGADASRARRASGLRPWSDRSGLPPASRAPPRTARATARVASRRLAFLARPRSAHRRLPRPRSEHLARDREPVRNLVSLQVMLPRFRRAKSERGQDAGSVRTGKVRARPRTKQRDALQPPGR